MRHLFIALRELDGEAVSVLRNLPGFTLLTPDDSQRWAIQRDGVPYPQCEALLAHRWTGAIPGRTGTWQLWQLSLVDPSRVRARALFRYLGRASELMPRLIGPWGLPRIKRMAAALAAEIAPEGVLPGVIVGDVVEVESAVDYDPSVEEITGDVDVWEEPVDEPIG